MSSHASKTFNNEIFGPIRASGCGPIGARVGVGGIREFKDGFVCVLRAAASAAWVWGLGIRV